MPRVSRREILKPLWENRQEIITKICPKCKKEFKDKKLNGYKYCKECNDK
jgi:hypothetical protein